MLDRRTFACAGAGVLVIARSVAFAQMVAKVSRVGFFLGASGDSVTTLFVALREGLRDLGYVEGRNVTFERRYADGHMDRLPEIAAELVRLKVDVIVTGSSIHVAAARQATTTIPIVMVFTADPVEAGFVKSLARPGGNVTGLSADASSELWSKYLTILKELVPRLSRVGVLGNIKTQVEFVELDAASRRLDIALEVADIRSPGDLDGAFSTMMGKRVGAVLVVVGPLTYLLKESIAEMAIKYRLPTISNADQYAEAGLLMSYGPRLEDLYRRAAIYVDKILRGASPADLPVEQPSRFELTINLKTARSIGLAIPQSLLLRAENVIQ
jgi:putative tryptophan/tyrosine transport system substrate-binding protein